MAPIFVTIPASNSIMAQNVNAFLNGRKEQWIERFARFGIISKGVVYCLIGLLAAMSAFGMRGQKMGKSDTFKFVYDQPFGKVLLILITLGMLGYVTWRSFQALKDIDHKGNDTRAKFTRIGYCFSALVYASLAFYAAKLALMGPTSGGDGNQRQFIVSKVLAFPAGQWLVGIAAALVFLQGLRQIIKGVSGKFCRNVQLIQSEYSDAFRKAGTIGYFSRGIVLVVIAYFFLRAAISHNEKEIQDTSGAFDFLQDTFGSVLMAIVAIGLVGYGIFQFVKAKYQRIDLNF